MISFDFFYIMLDKINMQKYTENLILMHIKSDLNCWFADLTKYTGYLCFLLLFFHINIKWTFTYHCIFFQTSMLPNCKFFIGLFPFDNINQPSQSIM